MGGKVVVDRRVEEAEGLSRVWRCPMEQEGRETSHYNAYDHRSLPLQSTTSIGAISILIVYILIISTPAFEFQTDLNVELNFASL